MHHRTASYGRGETLFTQGDRCDDVLFIRRGLVELSVVSESGREAILPTLGRGDFLGEECLSGLRMRSGSAIAVNASVIQFFGCDTMRKLLREGHVVADRFLAHLLARHVRMEEALIEELNECPEVNIADSPKAVHSKRGKPYNVRRPLKAGDPPRRQ